MAKFLVLALVIAAVVLESAHAACPTCTFPTSVTCTAFSSYLTCLKTITTANGCTDAEVTAATTASTNTQNAMNGMKCSGAGTIMTSMGLVLLFSYLAQWISGKTK
nr:hypothetical protein BgiMline_029520 [Biomphalaria glabrata]